MARNKKNKNNDQYFNYYTPFAADFETTTDNPKEVAVWSSAMIHIGAGTPCTPENVIHDNSMEGFINTIRHLPVDLGTNIKLYFHNAKFDCSYILDYLFRHPERYHQFIDKKTSHMRDDLFNMSDGEFAYNISLKNVIYSLTIRMGNYFVKIVDSYKLIPFSLAKIAKDFDTPHKKLEMDYGNKQPGYEPTEKEMEYIRNDVYVLKEGLERLALTGKRDINSLPLTIGRWAMEEYCEMNHFYSYTRRGKKKYMSGEEWESRFPSQVNPLPQESTERKIGENGKLCRITYDDYVRASYRGGWCYCSDYWKGKVIDRHTVDKYLEEHGKKKAIDKMSNYVGVVFDVNSLYPSVMHSKSGCFYPIGKGTYHKGEITKEDIEGYKNHKRYYFVHIRTEFFLKEGYLPTIQIKNDPRFNGREWLKSSITKNKRTGQEVRCPVELFLTCTDWELLKDHYNLESTEILSSIGYEATYGLFDSYVNKWADLKIQATKEKNACLRAFCKLMLNNLYGKFSTAPDGSYRMEVLPDDPDAGLGADKVNMEDNSRAVYIPIGSAITSWARNFTIRHAQQNYVYFCYADTDSLHMVMENYRVAKNIKEHPTDLCCWKCETSWDKAIFAAQKRYIEHTTQENHKDIEPYDNIKCCGMGANTKDYLGGMLAAGRYAVNGKVIEDFGYKDFKQGLVVPGNLKGEIVKGGTFLKENDFTFR